MSSYVLDNAHDAAATRLAILERLYDPPTRANLDAALAASRNVWEVGAGAGSVAAWLADQGAKVTATDIDLRHLSDAARSSAHRVLEHDVAAEEPPGEFDLIHARLVLSHLPNPWAVLRRLIGALRPGGWLCVEELDPMLDYAPARIGPADDLVNRVGRAFTYALASRGGDPTLGRKLHPLLARMGTEQVRSGGIIVADSGGGLVADLMAANVTQTAPLLADYGVTGNDLDAYLAAIRDSRQVVTMPVFWTARGRVPA